MKVLNVTIVCATVIVGLLIWKSIRPAYVVVKGSSGQVQAVRVDVQAMETLLKQDHNLSASMNAAVDQINPKNDVDFERIVGFIDDYVTQAKSIPLNDCPPDFAEAYYRNLGAWSGAAVAISAHPHVESGTESFVKNFIRGLKLDLQGPERDQDKWNVWADQVRQAQQNVTTTWTDVEALAARYGAIEVENHGN